MPEPCSSGSIRLDEVLARISAMLPLLKGETKRDPELDDISSAPDTLRDPGR